MTGDRAFWRWEFFWGKKRTGKYGIGPSGAGAPFERGVRENSLLDMNKSDRPKRLKRAPVQVIFDAIGTDERDLELSPLRKLLSGASHDLRMASEALDEGETNFRYIHVFTEQAVAKAMRVLLWLTAGSANETSRNSLVLAWDYFHTPALSGDAELWDYPCTTAGARTAPAGAGTAHPSSGASCRGKGSRSSDVMVMVWRPALQEQLRGGECDRRVEMPNRDLAFHQAEEIEKKFISPLVAPEKRPRRQV